MLYFAINRRRPPMRPCLVDSQTDLVIEGFPRSGNSFAYRAFVTANPSATVAHHTHAIAQIKRAAVLRRPTLIVIRAPEPAIRSLLVRRPHLKPAEAMRMYRAFHLAVLARIDRLLVERFDTVTQDFGCVIDSINRRYGTRFQSFSHEPESVERIFSLMDHNNASAFGGSVRATHVPRPHPERERLKSQLSLEGYTTELRQLHGLYEEIVGVSGA